MAIEIVALPIENGGSFHSYVSLPEGTRWLICDGIVPDKSEQLTGPPWHGSGPASAPLPRSLPIVFVGECPGELGNLTSET